MGRNAKGGGGKIPGARRRGSHSKAIAKKKEKREKTVPQQQQTDAFAKCAAELQIYVFVKVNRGSRAQIGQLETLNV